MTAVLPSSVSAGRVGTNRSGVGTNPPFRQGFDTEAIMSNYNGRDYEAAYNGEMFYAYSSLQTLSAVGTAITGLILWNSSSTKNLILRKIQVQVAVTSASLTGIALASTTAGAQVAAPTTPTVATKTGSTLIGGSSGVGTAYNVGTCLATLVIWPLFHNTAAINTVGVDALYIDLEGAFIVPPFTAVHLAALGAASAASAVTSGMTWQEKLIV